MAELLLGHAQNLLYFADAIQHLLVASSLILQLVGYGVQGSRNGQQR